MSTGSGNNPNNVNDIGKTVSILREAIEELENKLPREDGHLQQPPTTRPSSVSEIRRLFSPYAYRNQPRGRPSLARPMIKWSHKFSCLSSKDQDFVPQKEMKRQLLEAGLGEKRLVFDKSASSEQFKQTVLEYYPKLCNGGGFELLRTQNRTLLELIKAPISGFTAEYLSDCCSLGQSCVFIRPIQRDLDLDLDTSIEPSADCPREKCFSCHEMVPVINLKTHISNCAEGQKEGSLPVIKRSRSRLTPICKFTCIQEDQEIEEKISEAYKNEMTKCPICLEMFQNELIVFHSSVCGEEPLPPLKQPHNEHPGSSTENFEDALKEARGKIHSDKCWYISVLRKNFEVTSIDQLMESSQEDWYNQIRIKFINEDGIDAGGLKREFFSLLFQNQTILEEGNLTLNPNHLENQVYTLFGRAVALSIINGHPGPRCFNNYISNFIVSEVIPKFGDISDEEIMRADARAALQEIGCATENNVNQVFITHLDLLNQTGFNKQLTTSNINEALTAIKGYFLLYRTMAPLLQFIDGLKFLDVLSTLRKHPEEGILYFKKSSSTPPEKIIDFYKVCFSTDDKKETEETVMYNFEKFVKRLGRGKINSLWLDIEKDEQQDVNLTTGHLLQALLGCRHLPGDISSGLVLFDHVSVRLTHINTCAPSITFSNINNLKDYNKFEEAFLNIIVGSYGFGVE